MPKFTAGADLKFHPTRGCGTVVQNHTQNDANRPKICAWLVPGLCQIGTPVCQIGTPYFLTEIVTLLSIFHTFTVVFLKQKSFPYSAFFIHLRLFNPWRVKRSFTRRRAVSHAPIGVQTFETKTKVVRSSTSNQFWTQQRKKKLPNEYL